MRLLAGLAVVGVQRARVDGLAEEEIVPRGCDRAEGRHEDVVLHLKKHAEHVATESSPLKRTQTTLRCNRKYLNTLSVTGAGKIRQLKANSDYCAIKMLKLPLQYLRTEWSLCARAHSVTKDCIFSTRGRKKSPIPGVPKSSSESNLLPD